MGDSIHCEDIFQNSGAGVQFWSAGSHLQSLHWITEILQQRGDYI